MFVRAPFCALFLAALIASPAEAQCPGGQCGTGFVMTAPTFYVQPLYTWIPIPDAPAQVALYRGPWQIGGWDHEAGHYLPYDRMTGQYGAAVPCPIQPPAPPQWLVAKRAEEAAKAAALKAEREAKEAAALKTAAELKAKEEAAALVAKQKIVGPTLDELGPPDDPRHPLAAWQRNGVEPEKIQPKEHWTINGKTVTPRQGLQAIEGSETDKLQDDSLQPWLIVSGTDSKAADEFVARLKADPASATWLKQVRLWAGPGAAPNAPMMLDREGKPFRLVGTAFEAILEAPDGKILWHETEDRGDATISGLRNADPNYHPAQDPGPNKVSGPLNIPMPLLALVGAGAVLLLPSRKAE